jgi:molecular chaperone GrpE
MNIEKQNHKHNTNKNGQEGPRPVEKAETGEKMASKKEEKLTMPAGELEELKKKAVSCDEYRDKFLRLSAEFDNARKRMLKEKEELTRYAASGLIMEILPIIDDFDRLMEGVRNNQLNGAVLEGIRMIQKRLHEVLARDGLNKMKVVGEKFDPAKHEALMSLETDEYPEHTVVEEIRSGYLLHDKVLRHAIVKVATAKTTKELPKDESNEKPDTEN